MPVFIKAFAPLLLFLFLLLLRYLYLLRAKVKVKPIFKRGRKPAEDGGNNKNGKEAKPISKRKRKSVRINICFYRNTITNIFFIIFSGLIFFTVTEIFFLVLILFSFFRQFFYPFGSLFIYYITASAPFVIKYIITGAFGFVFFIFYFSSV